MYSIAWDLFTRAKLFSRPFGCRERGKGEAYLSVIAVERNWDHDKLLEAVHHLKEYKQKCMPDLPDLAKSSRIMHTALFKKWYDSLPKPLSVRLRGISPSKGGRGSPQKRKSVQGYFEEMSLGGSPSG